MRQGSYRTNFALARFQDNDGFNGSDSTRYLEKLPGIRQPLHIEAYYARGSVVFQISQQFGHADVGHVADRSELAQTHHTHSLSPEQE